MTKEEKFLLRVYEKASNLGDLHISLDPFIIGREMGFHDKVILHIVQGLTKSNFIKRDESLIYLTENGIRLAKSLA